MATDTWERCDTEVWGQPVERYTLERDGGMAILERGGRVGVPVAAQRWRVARWSNVGGEINVDTLWDDASVPFAQTWGERRVFGTNDEPANTYPDGGGSTCIMESDLEMGCGDPC